MTDTQQILLPTSGEREAPVPMDLATSVWTGRRTVLRGVEPDGIFVSARHQREGYAYDAAVLVLGYMFRERHYQKCDVHIHELFTRHGAGAH